MVFVFVFKIVSHHLLQLSNLAAIETFYAENWKIILFGEHFEPWAKHYLYILFFFSFHLYPDKNGIFFFFCSFFFCFLEFQQGVRCTGPSGWCNGFFSFFFQACFLKHRFA